MAVVPEDVPPLGISEKKCLETRSIQVSAERWLAMVIILCRIEGNDWFVAAVMVVSINTSRSFRPKTRLRRECSCWAA
jgi:hypothetical protein